MEPGVDQLWTCLASFNPGPWWLANYSGVDQLCSMGVVDRNLLEGIVEGDHVVLNIALTSIYDKFSHKIIKISSGERSNGRTDPRLSGQDERHVWLHRSSQGSPPFLLHKQVSLPRDHSVRRTRGPFCIFWASCQGRWESTTCSSEVQPLWTETRWLLRRLFISP